jgi:zinc-ribbon domain
LDPLALLLLFGVLLTVGLFVAQPFTGRWQLKNLKSRDISALLTERERALNSLMDLDMDNDIGKISKEDYSAQRALLIQKGAEILRQLDVLQPAKAPSKESIQPVAVEVRTNSLSDEDLEDLVARRRTIRQQKTAGFCPNCGKPILLSDQYCPSCGQLLLASQTEP